MIIEKVEESGDFKQYFGSIARLNLRKFLIVMFCLRKSVFGVILKEKDIKHFFKIKNILYSHLRLGTENTKQKNRSLFRPLRGDSEE